MESNPTYTNCYVCNLPFKDEIDWDNRHSDVDSGEDVHAECCVMCNPYPPVKVRTTMIPHCFKCDNELTLDVPDSETNYQFDNCLWVGFFGGYGMFVDEMMDFDEAAPARVLKGSDYEFVLCHECAHQFMDENPWLKKLFHPLNSHSHKTTYLETHPDHVGWDTLWHDAEREYLEAIRCFNVRAEIDDYPDSRQKIQEIMRNKIEEIKEKEGSNTL